MGLAVDDGTGAPVEIFATKRGISVARGLDRLESVSKNVVLIDALAFSVVPSDEKSYMLPLQEMAPFLCLGTIDHRPTQRLVLDCDTPRDLVTALAWWPGVAKVKRGASISA